MDMQQIIHTIIELITAVGVIVALVRSFTKKNEDTLNNISKKLEEHCNKDEGIQSKISADIDGIAKNVDKLLDKALE